MGTSSNVPLKACIAKKTRRYDFPPKPKSTQECYSHDLEQLVRAANLDIELTRLINSDLTFRGYWLTVRNWSEQSRYEFTAEQKARGLVEAVSDPSHGVLQWIKSSW